MLTITIISSRNLTPSWEEAVAGMSSPPAPPVRVFTQLRMDAFVHALLHIFTYIFALQVRGLLDVSRESPREVVDEAKSIFPENVV